MGRHDRTFVTEKQMSARCSPDRMMGLLLDSTSWPEWQPEIVRTSGPRRVGRGDIVSGNARLLGFHVEGRSIAEQVEDDVFEEDVVVGVAMRVRYEVHADGSGCRVTHRLESRMPGGASGRLLSLFLRARLRRMQRSAVERLVAQSEAAEPS